MARTTSTTQPKTRTTGTSTTSGTKLTQAQAKAHPGKIAAQQAQVIAVVMPLAAKLGHVCNYSAPLARVYVKAPSGFNPWVYCAALAKKGLVTQTTYRARKKRLTIVVPGGYPLS